jgi:hypothetical protein
MKVGTGSSGMWDKLDVRHKADNSVSKILKHPSNPAYPNSKTKK